MDYPVITSATLNSNTLTVKGFVGNATTNFAGAKVEVFIADNSPADQNGEVLAGDGRTKAHVKEEPTSDFVPPTVTAYLAPPPTFALLVMLVP